MMLKHEVNAVQGDETEPFVDAARDASTLPNPPWPVHTDAVLLDRIAVLWGMTDPQLRYALRMSYRQVDRIRRGYGNLREEQRLLALQRAGVTLRRPIFNYLEASVIARCLLAWARRGQPRERHPGVPNGLTDPQLLDVCRVALSLPDDAAVAAIVGVHPDAMRAIHGGKANLGVVPRLRLLRLAVPGETFADIERAMTCNRRLMGLLVHPDRHPVSDHARSVGASKLRR